MYLGHTHPDISFATHQCARYIYTPQSRAIKMLSSALAGVLRAQSIMVLDCYPDGDFAALWRRAHSQDPYCVWSRTGNVICFADCPILWKRASSIQTEIALSTMEAEYVALSTSCHDLFHSLTSLTRFVPLSTSANIISTTQRSYTLKSMRTMLVLWPSESSSHGV